MAKYKNKSPGMGKVMSHDKSPKKCDVYAAQKSDMGRLQKEKSTNRGYPEKAWEYKY